MSLDNIKVRNSDLFSGSMYRKLIQDYKAYDKAQKEYIYRLQKKLEYCKEEIAAEEYRIKEAIAEYKERYETLKQLVLETGEYGELMIKIQNQKETIKTLQTICIDRNTKIEKQKLEISELKNKLRKAEENYSEN